MCNLKIGEEMTQKSKITLSICISLVLGLTIIAITVLATILPKLNSFNSDNKTAVTIDELWGGSGFNNTNVIDLIETLSGVSGGTLDTINANITNSNGAITARQIRNYTINKNSGQSVIVTLGGFEWIVTYLSKSKSGDIVATLWLSGDYALDSSSFGDNIEFYGINNPNSGIPTNMYGTSYLRAMLNNGGNYIEIENNSSNPTSVLGNYDTNGYDENYKFKEFVSNGTHADGVLTSYIVTPEQISWQENGQSAMTTLNWRNNLSNENWSTETADTGFYSSAYNYAHKQYSDTWKDDYLWLPSFTEIGYDNSHLGMWSLSIEERSNGTGFSWSRSADYNNSSYVYGVLASGDLYGSHNISSLRTIRPAFHLNLTAVANAPTVEEIWNSSSEQFNLNNVQSLLNILSNSHSGSIATISQNIDSNGGAINASTIRAYTTGKANGDTVTLNLGGFKWQVVYLSKAQNNADDPSDDVAGDVIVTLWLSGDEILDTSTFGDSNRYNGTNNPNSGVPTNMYGTSYIRAMLNNGGNYINITSSSNPTSVDQIYTPLSDYKFADFVQEGVLTEYMVTPANISWQENGQSARTTLGFSHNMSNENWTDSKTGATADRNFFGDNNYTNKTFNGYGNSTWKGDYLWLPSLTEAGYSSSRTGIWGLSVAERSNGTTYVWSRSASRDTTLSACTFYSSGNNYRNGTVSYSYAVRPALHLNLSAVYDSFYRTILINYNSSQGIVEGDGEYIIGSTASLTATPATGYHFVNWTNSSGEILSTSATYKHPVTTNEIITANFAPNTYSVTLDQQSGTGGTASITATYNSAMPSATAPTRIGYTFQGYYTGENGSGKQYYTNTMASASNWTETTVTTLYAYWIINQYDVTTTVSLNGGGQVTGGGTYNHGDSVTITATPNAGYMLDYWLVNGEIVPAQGITYTFTITQNMDITAYFKSSLAQARATVGGEVRINGNDIGLSNNSTTVTYQALPYSGYFLIGWYLNDALYTLSGNTVTDREITLTANQTRGVCVTAVFSTNANEIPSLIFNKETNISIASNIGGQARMVGFADNESEITIIATTQAGYKFAGWYVDDTLLSENLSTTIDTTNLAGKTIVARFEPISSGNINDDLNNS